jgi:acetate kinase
MTKKPKSLAKGLVDRIGLGGSYICYRPAVKKENKIERPFPDYQTALHAIYKVLNNNKSDDTSSLTQISAIGHRVVHGGSKYLQPVLIDTKN